LDALLATQRSRQLTVATTVVIGVTIALVLLLAAIGLLAWRLVRREDARERAQDELLELLHASESEGESRLLLIRHVERLVPQAGAIVLNRNASDDRLEVTRGINADDVRDARRRDDGRRTAAQRRPGALRRQGEPDATASTRSRRQQPEMSTHNQRRLATR
jgi:hypothetical protein